MWHIWGEKSNAYRTSVGKDGRHCAILCAERRGKSVLSINLQRLSHAFVMGAAYLMLKLSQS
jgi:20S proteasome alpha/beta subunit